MRVRMRVNTYFVAHRSVSLVPTLTKVLPVASVAFLVSPEMLGMTVDLL